ncbi:MAG: TRAP transporter permease [Alphaproteobacteria bacterium]|nr:TRAP transporter permease [Alphaproteobacteria bacterium]
MTEQDGRATADAGAARYEFGAASRPLGGWEKTVFYWLAGAYTVFHLVVLNIHPLEPLLFRSLHVAWGSVIGFAVFVIAARGTADRVPWYDWLMIAGSLAAAAYIAVELDGLQFRAGALFTTADAVVGALGIFLVLEITRRTAGLALPILAVLFILYAFAGPHLPGVWHHRGYSPGFVFSYLYSDQGIFGITTAVSSTYIVLFVAFAAFLHASKAGAYFNDLAVALVGWARGGPAKVAVVSGVLFGTISGSAVANVVASGMITIPMMRRVGYDGPTAAAIEATSSTGGQITPPIMGAGAFIMAEVLGIPYTDIAIAAIMPTILFYLANYLHCDLHALKHGLRGLPRSELPPTARLVRTSHLFAPLVVLIGALIYGYSLFRAGTLGVLAAIVASWLSARGDRMGPRAIADALAAAARDSVQLVAVCACAGIIVGVIALTGLAGRFSAVVFAIAGDSRLLALVFAMVIALILGMGMPTTAAYAVAASVIAPGLVRVGIEPLTAHLFIFYYAVVSAITPPVALASFAAAGMAGVDPWRTSWIALKLGLATLIVPFMFVYGPELLWRGEILAIVHVCVTAAIGVFLLASATEGWFAGRPLAVALRVPLFAAAILLVIPEAITDLVGAGIAAAVWLIQRRRPASATPSAT